MNVEVTKLPESRVALKIELSPQEVEQAFDRTYKQLVQRVNIPGFRKGKAPRPMLERMVGPEFFIHEATEEAVRWGYRRAIDQENLTPIDEAEITPVGEDHAHLEQGHPFQFEASVSVRPGVQLPDYGSLKVEREPIEVTDEDVDGLLQEIRGRNATLEPTTRQAMIGDVVTMNITGKVDGEDVINEENADFELRNEDEQGPDPMLPGLSQQLEGVSRGDIREIPLPLPELYSNQELAGKTMFLRILVKEIKRKVLPELDDELAQSVSEFTTLDELRDALRANLRLERTMEADERLVQEAIQTLTSRTFVEIPPVLIDEEIDRMVNDLQNMFDSRHLSFADYLETAGKSETDIRNEMRDNAVSNVKTSLVLGALADAENIDVSNAEINAAMEELFRSANTGEAERRRLRSSSGVRANIRSRLRRQRAIRRLVEIMSGGEQVSAEIAEAMADQTSAADADTQETVAVEVGG